MYLFKIEFLLVENRTGLGRNCTAFPTTHNSPLTLETDFNAFHVSNERNFHIAFLSNTLTPVKLRNELWWSLCLVDVLLDIKIFLKTVKLCKFVVLQLYRYTAFLNIRKELINCELCYMLSDMNVFYPMLCLLYTAKHFLYNVKY